jgi:hypothetical protein
LITHCVRFSVVSSSDSMSGIATVRAVKWFAFRNTPKAMATSADIVVRSIPTAGLAGGIDLPGFDARSAT